MPTPNATLISYAPALHLMNRGVLLQLLCFGGDPDQLNQANGKVHEGGHVAVQFKHLSEQIHCEWCCDSEIWW